MTQPRTPGHTSRTRLECVLDLVPGTEDVALRLWVRHYVAVVLDLEGLPTAQSENAA